jgi:S1-C subfamily serine protease
MTWILVGAGVGGALLILLCGGVIALLVFRDKPAEVANNNAPPAAPMPPPQPRPQEVPFNQPVQGQPVVQPQNPAPPVQPANAPPAPVAEAPRNPAPANNGRLTGEPRARVKHATVFLHVRMPDGNWASGSGFFGCKEARNIVLTNAHVIGMLAPESMRPQTIEVVVHSGEADEWKTTARVLGVDRSSDLAVLDIGTPSHPIPEPLNVQSAAALQELDLVYVSGFPLGYALGKEISIRDTSVSALRRKNGQLNRIQLNGGMDPGNSGGPIVNNNGEVIGVAVSGIEGRQINFAIPGDRVHAILDGRVSELAFHQPYVSGGNKIAVPVIMDMIDPRNLIKEVGLEVWRAINRPMQMRVIARRSRHSRRPRRAIRLTSTTS